MPLQEQIVDVDFAGGLDEKTHPKKTVRLLRATNCIYRKAGALGKRYGLAAVATKNAYFTWSGGWGTPASMPQGRILATCGDALLKCADDEVDAIQEIDATDTIFKSSLPAAIVYRDAMGSGDGSVTACDVAHANGYVVVVSLSVAGTSYQLFAETVNVATGARIRSRFELDVASGGTTIEHPQAVAVGTDAVVCVWKKGQSIYAQRFEHTTGTWGLVQTIVNGTAAATSRLDVCAAGAAAGTTDRIAIAYEAAAGANRLTVTVRNNVAALTNNVTATLGTAITGITAIGVCWNGGANIGVAFGLVNGVNREIYFDNIPVSSLTPTGGFASPYHTVAGTLALESLGVCTTAAGAYFLTWSVAGDATTARTVWSLPAGGSAAYTFGLRLVSRPFRGGPRSSLYALAKNDHASHKTLFLVEYAVTSTLRKDTPHLRWVATVAPRTAADWTGSALSHVAEVTFAGLSTGQYFLGACAAGALPDCGAANLLDVRLGTTTTGQASWHRNFCELGGVTYFSGGVPTQFDGQRAHEVGFAWEPDAQFVTLTGGGGGSMTASGVYKYIPTYEHVDARGNRAESAPGLRADSVNGYTTVTLGAGNSSCAVRWPYLGLTLRHGIDTISGAAVRSVLYRTTAGGGTYQRQTAYGSAAANTNNVAATTTYQTVTDTLADTALQLKQALYTTSGTLGNIAPPSSAFVYAGGNRVWWCGTDDDAVWFSAEAVPGEQIRARIDFQIDPFEGGRVVGMGALGEDKHLILKSGSLWYVWGDGPNDTNTGGAFSVPKQIPSDVGCVNPRGIVSTPEGVMFPSQRGISLCTRQGQVVHVGLEIQDSLGASTGITAAVLDPTQNVVLFFQGARAYVYDLHYGSAQNPVWYVWDFTRPDSEFETITGAVMWNGALTVAWSDGRIHQMQAGRYWDAGTGSDTNVLVDVEWAPLKTAGLNGAQRVWFADVLCDRQSGFAATVTVTSDAHGDVTATRDFTDAEVTAMGRKQLRVHVAAQEAAMHRVRFTEVASELEGVNGEGPRLVGLSFEVGVERGLRKVASGNVK